MDKPNDHSTLSYMRTYIKNKKLNEKPIKLNMKRAETIKHLRKLGHWDSSVDGVKKEKGGIPVKGTSKKRITIGKEEIAKKRLDEYVKLHVKYINTFDKGLSKFSTFDSAKKESDKQLDKMADLVEPIAQSLILDYIKKTKGVTKARAQVKSLSKSLEERFDKLPKKPKKKPAPKEDEVRPVDKDVPKIKKKPAKKEDDVRPVDKDVPKIKKKATPPKGKNVGAKVKAIEEKGKDDKARGKEQPPTGPLIAKRDREAYVGDFYGKYKQTKSVYQVLKPFDKRLGGKGKAMLVPLDEVRKIRKKAMVKIHPDKGGDEENFKMVNDAFNALISSYKVPGYKTYSQIVNEEREAQAKAQQEAAKAKKK